MKTTLLHTVIHNYSRYKIDTVWENAQDLEHVAYLHSKTNRAFELLYAGFEDSEYAYRAMSYRSCRRLFCFGLQAMGFRRIVQKYQLHQIEYIPLLRLTVTLNSVLQPSGNAEFPTRMIDEVILTGPAWMKFLVPWFKRSLKRHTAIQCAEDEPFRERRELLESKGIRLPFSVFNLSQLEIHRTAFVESPAHQNRLEPSPAT